MELKIGIAGIGTIGTGVVHLIERNCNIIAEKTDVHLKVSAVADLDLERERDVSFEGMETYSDGLEMVRKADVDLVVELVGGIDFPKKLILEAIAQGRHVVTANKALLAKEGQDIYNQAEDKNLMVGIEASVAGGIPIIKAIREALAGNKIEEVRGIINGTSNFVLTKMGEDGLSFDDAVKMAQELGFAEADPALDINGGDAAHKIAILSSLAFNTPIHFEDVYQEGIEDVQAVDVAFAAELGYIIKLIGIARDRGELGVEARVHPMLVPEYDQLSGIRNEFNAVFVQCDYLGDAMFTGKGAGAFPTASAVVSDIVDIGRKMRDEARIRPIPKLAKNRPVVPFGKTINKYYLRFSTQDKPGILSRITGVLGDHNIGIASVIQRESASAEYVSVVMLTHEAREANIQDAIEKINELDCIREDDTVFIRAF